MTISTYAQLQAAVLTWTERTGAGATDPIVANITDLIAICESRLNRTLPHRFADTTLTGTASSRQLTLPSDYAEPKRLQLTTNDEYTDLKPSTAATMDYIAISGTPDEWCINGSYIDLNRPCDQAHTFRFRYRQKLALSDSATTNWLLTAHPDVYLFGTLVEAADIAEFPERAPVWNARYMAALEEVAYNESRGESIATLNVDPALWARGGTFDYTSGQ